MNTFEESRKRREGDPVYQFVNREGNLVRSVEGGLFPVGKAYAFFNCNASNEEVERELLKIPNSLELHLSQGEAPLFQKYLRSSPLGEALGKARGIITYSSSDLRDREAKVAECYEARNREFDYVLEAYSLNKSNEEVGLKLGKVMNGLYTSPLYKKGENMRSSVICEIDKEYQFLE